MMTTSRCLPIMSRLGRHQSHILDGILVSGMCSLIAIQRISVQMAVSVGLMIKLNSPRQAQASVLYGVFFLVRLFVYDYAYK